MPSLQSYLFRLYLNYFKATINWHTPVPKLRALMENNTRWNRPPKGVVVKPVVVGGVPAEWVGSDEILLSDSTRLAEQAQAAGVEVTLEIWPGMWHVWHIFTPYLPEAKQAIAAIGAFVRSKQHLNQLEGVPSL